MGLFNFVREIGKKIFGSEAEAPLALENLINADNPGVENIKISVQDGIATLTGDATSAAALEKAVLIVGNTQGIQEVKADAVVIKDGSQVAGDDEFYVIQKGDTLWKIAEQNYGNGAKYTKIVEVNLEVIKNADLIFPGQKIRIPKSI